MDRPDLMTALRRRMEAFEAGDTQAVTDLEALRELVDLLLQVEATKTGIPFAVMDMAAGLHWCRAKALPGGRDSPELGYSAVLWIREQDRDADLQADLNYLTHLATLFVGYAARSDNPGTLDMAIALLSAVLSAVSPDYPARPALLHNFAYGYRARYERTGSATDLNKAVQAARAALRLMSPDHPEWGTTRDNLAVLLQARFQQNHDQADLDEFLDLQQDVFEAIPGSQASLPELMAALMHRVEAFDAGDQGAVLDSRVTEELIGLMVHVLQEHRGVPPTDIAKVMAEVHWRRHLALPPGAEAEDELRQAVEMFSWVAETDLESVPAPILGRLADPEVVPADVDQKARLALAMTARAEYADDEMLTQAIDLMNACLQVAPADYPHRAALLASLSFALRVRFARTSSEADLEASVRTGTEAARASETAPEARGGALANLGSALLASFERRGDATVLDQAVACLREALTMTIDEDPSYLMVRSNLGAALLARFHDVGDAAVLHEAIPLLRAVAEETGADDPRRAVRYSNLANSLRSEFERSGDLAALEEAARTGRKAVAAAAVSNPERAAYQSSLGETLRLLFDYTGKEQYLDDAVTVSRDAAENTPGDYSELSQRLSKLSMVLLTRFERGGRGSDLAEAVNTSRRAVDTSPADHPGRAYWLSNLGSALRAQYHYTGRRRDLAEAMGFSLQAMEITRSDHPDRPVLLSNLTMVLLDQFEYEGSSGDLTYPVQLLRQAVSEIPAESPKRATMVSNLIVVLVMQLRRNPDGHTVEEAIRLAREAVSSHPEGSPGRGIAQLNLSGALYACYQARDNYGDLEEAIATTRETSSTIPEDHPNYGLFLSNLADMLLARFERSRAEEDLNEALSAWARAASLTAAPVAQRLTAARQAAETTAQWRGPDQAVEAYATAVGLLPLLAYRGIGFLDQQQLLTPAASLARDGAACAIAAGRLDYAVELLEQGRGVYWSQLLDLRTDLTAHARRAPELAGKLSECRAVLEQPVPLDEDHLAADARMAAAQRFDDLVREVRALPPTEDFPHPETFLRPVPYANLLADGQRGQIVIINISRWRCDALLADHDGITGVALRDLTEQQIVDMANQYLRALHAFDQSGNTPADRLALEKAMTATLEWLWAHICAPILSAAGHVAPPTGSWPRLWWCPTGALGLFPLHAAGYHGTDNQSVYDRVVSSYAPTLQALTRKHFAYERTQPKMLIVAIPEIAGPESAGGLQSPDKDLSMLTEHFGPEERTVLAGQDATRAAILAEVGRHRWLHASCHGTQDLARPSDGGLAPYDVRTAGLITMADLTRPGQTGGELAFLSACKTATIGVANPDEAITVAAAMQHAGWRHTVGTLWAVWDTPSATVAADFYAKMFESHHFRPDNAAYALHEAVRKLRSSKSYAENPSTWAPYIHIGP